MFEPKTVARVPSTRCDLKFSDEQYGGAGTMQETYWTMGFNS